MDKRLVNNRGMTAESMFDTFVTPEMQRQRAAATAKTTTATPTTTTATAAATTKSRGAEVSPEVLRKSIKEILDGADLNTTSNKTVRQQLEKRLNVPDLTGHKSLINSIIMETIKQITDSKTQDKNGHSKDKETDGQKGQATVNESQTNNCHTKPTTSDDNENQKQQKKLPDPISFSSSDDDQLVNALVNEKRKGQKPKKDEKAKKLTKVKPPPSKNKIRTNDDDSLSSSSDDNQLESDEKLARRLQEEDTGRRVTRRSSGGVRRQIKSAKIVKSNTKKRKKDSADLDSDDKSHSDQDRGSASKNESQKKPKNTTTNTKKNGYTSNCRLSAELAAFVGQDEMPRHEIVKRIWTYVKEKDLLDPKNKQFALCDNELLKIFGRKRFRMFGMMKFLTNHINQEDETY